MAVRPRPGAQMDPKAWITTVHVQPVARSQWT
jgi:hypothetical protein